MPDIDSQPELSHQSERFAALNFLAERLVVLDETALGAAVHSDLDDLSLEQRAALTEWREAYSWQIAGFFEHFRRAETYPAKDVDDTIELAKRLVSQAELFMSRS